MASEGGLPAAVSAGAGEASNPSTSVAALPHHITVSAFLTTGEGEMQNFAISELRRRGLPMATVRDMVPTVTQLLQAAHRNVKLKADSGNATDEEELRDFLAQTFDEAAKVAVVG